MLTTESRSRRSAESSAFATAMRSHPTNSGPQHQACFPLAFLSLHADVWVKIEAAGGIECIATVMRRHPTNSELQHRACFALANLARHADNRVKIETLGGIECVVTAMRSHPTNGQLPTVSYKTEHVLL
jgi:hypothetical protein